MSKLNVTALRSLVHDGLAALANKDNAPKMAAYMKTDMPFFGVKKPERLPLMRRMVTEFKPDSLDAYEAAVRALWKGKHREEKYAAIFYAARFKAFITVDALPLYEALVREGAWWDLVDDVAIHLIGAAYLKERKAVERVMDRFILDKDMWIRRTAIISQNKHRKATDEARLFRYCQKTAHEKEFFIRKAIGWALREYGSVEPSRVLAFVDEHREELSGLSIREACKHLG